MDGRPSGGRKAPGDRTRRTGRLVRRLLVPDGPVDVVEVLVESSSAFGIALAAEHVVVCGQHLVDQAHRTTAIGNPGRASTARDATPGQRAVDRKWNVASDGSAPTGQRLVTTFPWV
jgi:hypothetical protein